MPLARKNHAGSDKKVRMGIPNMSRHGFHIYKAAFEYSLQAIFITRPDTGAIIGCNAAACKMFGYTQEEFKELGRKGIIDHDWGNFHDDLVTRNNSGSVSGELMAIKKNGEHFPCEYSSVISVDDDSVACSVFFLSDITDRRRQEAETMAALAEANAAKDRYKNVLESISDAYISIDSNWHFTYLNEKAAAIIRQKTPKELLGKHIWEEFPEAANNPFYNAYQKVMNERQPVSFEDYYEPWDIYFETRIYPGADGGLTVFFTDVTQQRRIMNRVRQSEQEMKMILDNTEELFMIVDRNLCLIAQNKAYAERMREVMGKDLEKGHSILQALRPSFAEDIHRICERVLAGEKIKRKFVVPDTGGNEVVFDTSFLPIFSEDGQVEKFMIAVVNITEEEKVRRELKSSEEKYRHLFYSNPLPFWIADQETNRFLDVNDAAINHYGYSREEFLRMSLLDIRPDEEKSTLREIKNSTEFNIGTLLYRGQSRHKRRNGEIITVDITAYGLFYNGRKAVLISAADITNLKNAEGQLRNSETKLRSLIENASEVIVLADRDGTVRYMSSTVSRILGYKAEDRIGIKPFDAVHPDDLPKIKAGLAKLVSEPNGRLTMQWRHKHADGSWRWMDGVATNLLDNPAVNAIVHNFRDITMQKETEDALRAHNERFRLVAKATQDSIWDWDLIRNSVTRDGKRLETAFGYDGWEASDVDYYWNKLAHPEDWAEVTKKRNALLEDPSQNYWQDEYRFLRADGKYGYIHDCGYILRDGQGKAVRIIGASHDITKQKKYEEDLKEKNNELKRLSAYLQRVREDERKYIAREVHDELGQLASALKIDVDWLNLRLTAVEDMVRRRIEHANHTIEVLISSVRKIASNLRPSVLDDFGLNAALKWHCTEFQNLNGIQCLFDPGFDDSALNMQVKTELFRMTQESLTNVMRHAKANSVVVMTREDQHNYYLSVTDNGRGFNSSQQKNTLGLVGLRERALSVNGKLEIESEPGKGTTISVQVPKKQ